MCVDNQPPDESKEEPRQDEAECEGQESPSPLPIHHGGVHVLQETNSASLQVLLHHIAVTIFEDRSSANTSHAARPEIARSVNRKSKYLYIKPKSVQCIINLLDFI